MALQFRQANFRAYAQGQEELQNRLKKLREQKDVVASLINDMMQRAELAASRLASVTNITEFLRHFEVATGSIERVYMKMFQVHFLLIAEEAFGSGHFLRPPMAITYSVPDSMARNGAQGAPLETSEGLHCFSTASRPPSIASLDLSVCDNVVGAQPARVLPQQYGSVQELGPQPACAPPQQYGSVQEPGPQPACVLPQQYGSVEELSFAPGKGRGTLLPPSGLAAYTSPGAPSEVPHGLGYPVLKPPFARSLEPALAEDSGAQAVLATPPPTLAYGSPEPQQQFAVPPASTSHGDVPEIQLPSPQGCTSPDSQFSDALSDIALPPTPGYRSPEGQGSLSTWPKIPSPPASPVDDSFEGHFLRGCGRGTLSTIPSPPVPPVGDSSEGRFQVSRFGRGCRRFGPEAELVSGPGATPRAEAPVQAVPTAKRVAPSPVQLASTAPQKPTKGAIKEDVRDRGDTSSLLAEADRGYNNGSQPHGEGKPAGKKASVSVNNSCSQPHGEGKPSGRKASVAANNCSQPRGEGKPAGRKASVAVNNSCSQPHGDGKPAGRKASVSGPLGFPTSIKQPSGTDTKPLSPGNSLLQTEPSDAATVGSIKLQSPGSQKYFTIPPAETSIIGSTRRVVFSFYKSPSEFWLQLESSGEVLDGLLKNLAAYYRSSAYQEFKATVGMHCVAHYAEDNHWYRAQILEMMSDHAKVCYVDFGNCDRVKLQELRLLAEQFASIPVQAFCCSIKMMGVPMEKKTWPLSEVRQFWEMVNKPETKLEAIIYLRDNTTGRFIVDILGLSMDRRVVNVSREFLKMCKAEEQKAIQAPSGGREMAGPMAKHPPVVGAPAATSAGCKPPPATGPPAGALAGISEQRATAPHTTVSGGVASTGQDCMISLKPSASAAAAPKVAPETASAPITAIVATGPPLTSTVAGAKPAVTTRAGRPVGATKVAKPTAPQTVAKPPSGIPPAGLLSEGAVSRLPCKQSPPDITRAAIPPDTVPPDTVPPDTVPAVPSPLPPLPTVVLPPGIPPPKLPSGKTFSFILSAVFSPSDFYGQILDDNGMREVMQKLKQQLNQHGATSSAPPPESVTKGSFWVCLFDADKNYYRVQILDVGNTNNGRRARVLYVDYGNRSVVTMKHLRPLPDDLAKPPAWAHRLALAMVSPIRGKWEETATKAFVAETGFKTVLVGEKRGQRQAGLETVTEVVLWNKNGPTPVNVNISLVEKKLAQLKSS